MILCIVILALLFGPAIILKVVQLEREAESKFASEQRTRQELKAKSQFPHFWDSSATEINRTLGVLRQYQKYSDVEIVSAIGKLIDGPFYLGPDGPLSSNSKSRCIGDEVFKSNNLNLINYYNTKTSFVDRHYVEGAERQVGSRYPGHWVEAYNRIDYVPVTQIKIISTGDVVYSRSPYFVRPGPWIIHFAEVATEFFSKKN